MATQREVAKGMKKSSAGNGGSRGTVNNARRLEIFSDRKSGNTADWGGCDPKWLLEVVVGITEMGGAVTFGLSRDGGAYSVTLLLDSDRQTLWFNGDAELNTELEQVVAVLDTMK